MMKLYRRPLKSFAFLAILVACVCVTFGFAPASSSHAQSSSGISVNDFKLPGGSDPWGTAIDSKGDVWVAAPGCDPQPRCSGSTSGDLDVFNPHSNQWVKSISLPGNYSQPFFIAFDHAGQAWFTMPMSNTIGVYNPAHNSFNQWAIPTSGAGPWDIAIDSHDTVWVTEHYGYKVASFNAKTHNFKEYATSSTISAPYGVTVDSKDNVWFTQNTDAVAKIGEISAKGHLSEYRIRNSNTAGTGLTPHMITVTPSGDIAWSEGWVGSIGILHVAAAKPGTNKGVTEYQYDSNGNFSTHTSGISASSDGRLWVDDAVQNTVGYFDGNSFTFTKVPGNNPHPHDGLSVDSNDQVWFDEEFSNALGNAS